MQVTKRGVSAPRRGVSTPPAKRGQYPKHKKFLRNTAQRGDAIELLRSLSESCSALCFFDPEFREVMDRLKFGNEGARQSRRFALPQMTSEFIDDCLREMARVLRPSGYVMLWSDAFRVCEGYHKRVADIFYCVDLIGWDDRRGGQGKRSRRCGGYVVVLQKPPKKVNGTWFDHRIRDRWIEEIDKSLYPHPHAKPLGLIRRLIGATTKPGDLVIDPCAGSFVVLDACRQLGREFIGVDLAYQATAKRSAA